PAPFAHQAADQGLDRGHAVVWNRRGSFPEDAEPLVLQTDPPELARLRPGLEIPVEVLFLPDDVVALDHVWMRAFYHPACVAPADAPPGRAGTWSGSVPIRRSGGRDPGRARPGRAPARGASGTPAAL